MKNDLLISVVIPTLNNRKQFLLEAIQSVENQSYLPYEIIIINNGEGKVQVDHSLLKIRQYKITFKSGVAMARNFGANKAKTKYVAFLDDDDFWGEHYLKYMKDVIEKNQPDCLIGRLDQYLDNKIYPHKNAEGLIKEDIILVKNPGITGSSIVIKKNVFQDIGGFNINLPTSEDKSLILELIEKKFNIVSVSKSQAILRNSNEVRLSNSKDMYFGILNFYKIYKHKMNLSQKIINIFKINKYLWRFKKSILGGLLYIFFFLIIEFEKILKNFLNKK